MPFWNQGPVLGLRVCLVILSYTWAYFPKTTHQKIGDFLQRAWPIANNLGLMLPLGYVWLWHLYFGKKKGSRPSGLSCALVVGDLNVFIFDLLFGRRTSCLTQATQQ